MLDADIKKELADKVSLLPPWKKYPGMNRFAAFWRMGSGEWYLMMWEHWTREFDYQRFLAYFQDQAPIPVAWADWVSVILVEGDKPADDPEPGVRRLGELGLVNFEEWKQWWEDALSPQV